ncbi:MAG: amidohydrolase family protein [Nocardioidaceae bacterium]
MIVDGHATLGRVDDAEFAAEELLAQMDAAGVDVAIVSPDAREIAVAHRDGNDRLLELCTRHPGRLLAYAVANPWLGAHAVAELGRALDAGSVAIKLNPFLQGFQPIDHLVDPVLELAAEHRVPVYVHSGTPVHCTPFQIAVMASRFPQVPFILGRGGKTDFKADTPHVLRSTPNLYGDTAHDFPLTGILDQLNAGGPSRVLFTSDFPYGDLRHEVRRVRALPVDAESLRDVLGENLLRLLPDRARASLATGEPG